MALHRARAGARALHLKARHHALQRARIHLGPALAHGRRHRRRGRRREGDRPGRLGQHRLRSRQLGRLSGRLGRRLSGRLGGRLSGRLGGSGGNRRGRGRGGGSRGASEAVEDAAGELRAGHVLVAGVPEHRVAAHDVNGRAVALQQADSAASALLVREVERRCVDLEAAPTEGLRVLRRQASGGLGGGDLVVGVAQAHGRGGAGDELEGAGGARVAVEQARAVAALDLAHASEVALRQVILLLKLRVEGGALLGGGGGAAGSAAGGEALRGADLLEGAVHGGDALVAGEVGVDRVDVDLAAHGAPDRVFLDASFGSHGGGFGVVDAEGGSEAGDAAFAEDFGNAPL